MYMHNIYYIYVRYEGEMTRLEVLKHHTPRVANVVVDVNPLGTAGLGENSPHWASK